MLVFQRVGQGSEVLDANGQRIAVFRMQDDAVLGVGGPLNAFILRHGVGIVVELARQVQAAAVLLIGPGFDGGKILAHGQIHIQPGSAIAQIDGHDAGGHAGIKVVRFFDGNPVVPFPCFYIYIVRAELGIDFDLIRAFAGDDRSAAVAGDLGVHRIRAFAGLHGHRAGAALQIHFDGIVAIPGIRLNSAVQGGDIELVGIIAGIDFGIPRAIIQVHGNVVLTAVGADLGGAVLGQVHLQGVGFVCAFVGQHRLGNRDLLAQRHHNAAHQHVDPADFEIAVHDGLAGATLFDGLAVFIQRVLGNQLQLEILLRGLLLRFFDLYITLVGGVFAQHDLHDAGQLCQRADLFFDQLLKRSGFVFFFRFRLGGLSGLLAFFRSVFRAVWGGGKQAAALHRRGMIRHRQGAGAIQIIRFRILSGDGLSFAIGLGRRSVLAERRHGHVHAPHHHRSRVLLRSGGDELFFRLSRSRIFRFYGRSRFFLFFLVRSRGFFLILGRGRFFRCFNRSRFFLFLLDKSRGFFLILGRGSFFHFFGRSRFFLFFLVRNKSFFFALSRGEFCRCFNRSRFCLFFLVLSRNRFFCFFNRSGLFLFFLDRSRDFFPVLSRSGFFHCFNRSRFFLFFLDRSRGFFLVRSSDRLVRFLNRSGCFLHRLNRSRLFLFQFFRSRRFLWRGFLDFRSSAHIHR